MRWAFSQTAGGCKHTIAYKERNSGKNAPLTNLSKAYKFLSRRAEKTPVVQCMQCPKLDGWKGRQFLCLHCVHVCCKDHIKAHSQAGSHHLFVDISSTHVFCTKCDDYVYDPEFERVAWAERAAALNPKSTKGDAGQSPWNPKNSKDRTIIQKHFEHSRIISSSLSAGLGLRGLCNLGNTCYTSCVIQALVHNPLLRNYFLGGMHKKTNRCRQLSMKEPEAPKSAYEFKPGDKIEARWKSTPRWYPGVIMKEGGNDRFEVLYDDGDTEYDVRREYIRHQLSKKEASKTNVTGESCLGCAANSLFFEMYSGTPTQVAPYKLLFAVWQHSKHLAGYSQQDAHEFFIALLDGLHEHLGGKQAAPADRNSIIQRIFTGALQSDVTCTSCEAVSTTLDPFWDISLDVRPIAHMPTPQKTGDRFDFIEPALGAQPSVDTDSVNTLHDCLCRYTRTEQLSTSINCAKCGDRRPATKRMSMSKLPMVIVFHLKRFEHGHGKESTKIGSPVKFPEQLDMKPYLAESIASGNGLDAHARAPEVDDSYAYSLYCVVNHHGSLQNGHYTTYVRQAQPGGQWYLCDDEHIRMASLADVLASEGYMLFYIKRKLEYE